MFSRLQLFLVQLKVGNNSEKLKNEIKQLLYSFYCLKKNDLIIYNGLINTAVKNGINNGINL